MGAIEEKEIRGMSLKTLWYIIGATVSIMLTVLTSYTSLRSDITDLRTQKDGDARYNDLRMRVIEQKVDMNTLTLKDLGRQFDETKPR